VAMWRRRVQVGRQAVRVADQGDALAALRHPPRLLHRKKGLSEALAQEDGIPLPAPQRTSIRLSSRMASRTTHPLPWNLK
jgi:hypothetical protein